MADFSKQYCELYDPEMPWDFDIMKEYEQLPSGHYVPFICEGFGFIAIAKDENGECTLAMYDDDSDIVHWLKYDEVVK